MRTRTYMVSQKNVMLINFAQSLVSIGFSCNVSEFQNTGHSQRFSPWEVVGAWFYDKNSMVINFVQSLVLIDFSCTVS
ncbi:hypothetical protein GW17_00057678 [Ensete ventricosum]|nr:hypothetical protein GW17_00057678 [Ensete ventricosum]